MGAKRSSSSSLPASSGMSRPVRRVSISTTSSGFTPSCAAIDCTSAGCSVLLSCFMPRRLKNSLRCALVVAIFTRRQFFRMYSWISALIQWIANDTRRTPRVGSKRLTAFIRPMLPSWMRSAWGRP